MTQQRADYPLDYTNGTAPTAEPTAKDRIREMADSAGDQLQHVAENAQEIAAKVADQRASTVRRPRRPSRTSSRSWRSRSRTSR